MTNLVPIFVHPSPITFCTHILEFVSDLVCLSAFIFVFTADAELTPVLRLGAGACAGIIAMSATYPMDMVRGRLTVQVNNVNLL